MSIIDYSWDFSKEDFSLDLDFFNEKEQEDKLWQARTGLDHETLCGAIETIIFMNDKPVNLLKIKNQIDPDLPLRVIHESIAKLQQEYEQKHHGIRLMEVAQGYQFRTKATYSKIVQNMFKVQSLQLSPTALEVLAIVAYKQPISKTSVESIRGVDSSHIVRALMDRRLVKVVGRSDEIGRPSLYGTTAEFLEIFNLNTIDDLPSEIELEELANANEIGQISDIKTIVQTGDKKRFDMDELLELDEISQSIKDISSDTQFTISLKDMDKVRKTDEGVEKKSAFDILEEYVSKAQITQQNKVSSESEVLTSVMEPTSVSLQMLDQILNAPEEDNELEIEVELEGESSLESEELLELKGDNDFNELDSSECRDLEEKSESVLAKSEELLNSLLTDPENALETQAASIETEVDAAFDFLLGDEETTSDEHNAQTSSSSNELDISSFISQKIAEASIETQADETAVEDESEEEEALASALDEAFKNLTGESLDEVDESLLDSDESSEDLDVDLSQVNPSDFSEIEGDSRLDS